MNTFNLDQSIRAFNQLYGLSAPELPTLPETRQELITNIRNFYTILSEELDESEEIINAIETGSKSKPEIAADLADWLGDIIIYCASELVKHGFEPSTVLGIIMSSNMSKLGADGKPIYDERGKVLKGPNYWKPEPQLQRYIVAAARQAARGAQDGN